MNCKVILYSAFVFLCSMSGASYASVSIAEIKKLHGDGYSDKAYEMAQRLLIEHEGELSFDLVYSELAIDHGDISEGVFALERVLLVDPQRHTARLELARAYFLLADNARAKEEFSRVLAHKPPAEVVAHINEFLKKIETSEQNQKLSFTASVGLSGGYDSNINSSPESQTAQVTLSTAALGRGDHFQQLALSAEAEYMYSNDHSFVLSSKIDARSYDDESDQDYLNGQLSVMSRWMDSSSRYQVSAGVNHYQLDNEGYRDSYQLAAQWTRAINQNTLITSTLNHGWLKYKSLAWKDSTQTSLGLNVVNVKHSAWQPVFFAGAFMGRELPEVSGLLADASVDRFFHGGHVGVRISPFDNLELTSTLVAQTSQYQGQDWFYQTERKDKNFSLGFDLSWDIYEAVKVNAGVMFSRNDSNVELYDYDRNQINLGLKYGFK